jgi:hypothetical protein
MRYSNNLLNFTTTNNFNLLQDHIHFFVSLISQVINSLEKPPTDIFEHIDKIGKRNIFIFKSDILGSYHFHHLRQCGFKAQMWDRLGVCLVDAISIQVNTRFKSLINCFQDCVRVFPEACKAWTIMVAALIDR